MFASTQHLCRIFKRAVHWKCTVFAIPENAKAVPVDFEEDRAFICSRTCAVDFLTEVANRSGSPGFMDTLPAIASGLVWDISLANPDVTDTFSANSGDIEQEDDQRADELTGEMRILSKGGSVQWNRVPKIGALILKEYEFKAYWAVPHGERKSAWTAIATSIKERLRDEGDILLKEYGDSSKFKNFFTKLFLTD